MKKTQLILILTFFYFNIYSQNVDQDSIKYGDHVSIESSYGWILPTKVGTLPFNNIQSIDINRPLQNIGFTLNVAYNRDGIHETGFRLTYAQFLPHQLNIDTLQAQFNGGIFSCNLMGVDLTKKSKFSSIILGLGFSAGRLKISSTEFRTQKNPFFCPLISIDPRFYVGHLAISSAVSYQIDVSNPNWRNVKFSKDTREYDINAIKLSGIIAQIGLGWKF